MPPVKTYTYTHADYHIGTAGNGHEYAARHTDGDICINSYADTATRRRHFIRHRRSGWRRRCLAVAARRIGAGARHRRPRMEGTARRSTLTFLTPNPFSRERARGTSFRQGSG